MMPLAPRTRPDQIAELTCGVELPLQLINKDIMEIIAEVLQRAFNDIQASAPGTVSSGTEAEVTALLEARLNSLVGEDPIWGQLVLCVARGKESLSFDGSHLEKRPDLSIYLTNRHRSFPLIVEAKIIDGKSGKTEVLYCQNGVRRFLDGEYGWGGREAFMLGYVRDGSTIDAKLKPYLTPPARASKTFAILSGPDVLPGRLRDCARSRHSRGFVYLVQGPAQHKPGFIDLWHVWLK
jgi:hypothetical protein